MRHARVKQALSEQRRARAQQCTSDRWHANGKSEQPLEASSQGVCYRRAAEAKRSVGARSSRPFGNLDHDLGRSIDVCQALRVLLCAGIASYTYTDTDISDISIDMSHMQDIRILCGEDLRERL